MRKAQKKQAEEFTKLLGQAHNEIKKTIERKQFDAAMDLLEQCQSGAIELGNMIEHAEGEGFVTIPLLEEYCELVYQNHEAIWNHTPLNANKICKNLQKSLNSIKNSIKNDISVRLEAVFLPYKASMWDSLESVWEAANEDPNCDAYVIPIPYYDRDSTGKFSVMHYEGDLYPDYVPITRYDEYDFAENQPDMIFIHNPYDDCNYVTSVDPFFYSDKLKQYTKCLVYIPYFILGEINPDDEEAVKNIAHFCTASAVFNADKVIVQSEDMRKVYIKVLTKITGEQTKKYWEKKILGIGSPKVDKVLSTQKENLKIPEEWMKVIQKEDGSWKKIIFYNTSVQALLDHNEKMLEKIKDVFNIFKENQDEVALLWRPHPLMEATIKSVRPWLWKEYLEVVKKYKEEGWGIYDDTAELERAVELSDAYYGDASSVVQLYQKTGKSIMYQNVKVLSNEKIHLNCTDIVKYNNKLYILTRDAQCLFEYCLITKKMKFCGTIKNEEKQFYISMTLCKQILYIVPYEGNYICTYDIDKREFKHIFLEPSKNELVKKYYQLCFSYHNKIYLLGGKGSSMICLDPVTNKISELSEWIFDFKKKYNCDAAVTTHANICIVKECFWVAIKGNNILLEYNMNTNKYHFWNVGKKEIQYVTVTFDGEYFWLSGDKKFIVRWKKESNEIKEFNNFPLDFEYGNKKIAWKELFSNGYIWNESIYFSPLNSNMLIKFDKNSGNMKCILKVDFNHICFEMMLLNEEEIYMETLDMNSLLRANSYCISKDDQYKESFLTFGIHDEINKNCLRIQNKVSNENYPLLPFVFPYLGNSKNNEKKYQTSIGEKIIKNIIIFMQ